MTHPTTFAARLAPYWLDDPTAPPPDAAHRIARELLDLYGYTDHRLRYTRQPLRHIGAAEIEGGGLLVRVLTLSPTDGKPPLCMWHVRPALGAAALAYPRHADGYADPFGEAMEAADAARRAACPLCNGTGWNDAPGPGPRICPCSSL